MRARSLLITVCTLSTLCVAGRAAQEEAPRPPLAISSVRITLEGTSRRGPFSASTRTARVTAVRMAEPRSPDVVEQALQPGQLEALDISIPVLTLTSSDKGAAEHIRFSLKSDRHPDIRFRLRSIDKGPGDARGFIRLIANGVLTIAGVDRDAVLSVTAVRAGRSVIVDGATDVLMTDFGVTPPAGPFGSMKTDPLIHVRFSLIVSATD